MEKNRFRVQVIEQLPSDNPNLTNTDYEIIWDFSQKNQSLVNWLLWFANDPPQVTRITCETEDLREALCIYHNQNWKPTELDLSVPLAEADDQMWRIGPDDYPIVLLISTKIASLE